MSERKNIIIAVWLLDLDMLLQALGLWRLAA